MTAVAERRAAPVEETLKTLARVEARRYARHPLFLLGAGLLVWSSVVVSNDPDVSTSMEFTIAPAFMLGLLGVLVGYQLTRSMARSADAVEAAPADGVVRTAALCLACLVPGVVGLAWVVWQYVTSTQDTTLTGLDRITIVLAGAVAAVGGPLFGVMVGRWTRFPGAGLVAAVVLSGWTVLNTAGLIGPSGYLNNLVRLNPPMAFWITAKDVHSPYVMVGGSPWWHLVYMVLLCGLAAIAAMVHEATGGRRARLWRVLAVLGGLALVSLGLAVADDPGWVRL
jgi:hypothetical protein